MEKTEGSREFEGCVAALPAWHCSFCGRLGRASMRDEKWQSKDKHVVQVTCPESHALAATVGDDGNMEETGAERGRFAELARTAANQT